MNIGMVLLAAGNSQRFGGKKQFQIIHGEPMYLKMAKKLAASSDCSKVLVTQFEEMKSQVKELGFKTIQNLHPEWGISHSIHLGMDSFAENQPDGILFAVCDQPFLLKESIEKLVSTFFENPDKIICLSYQEQLGNPVIFPSQYQQELRELSGDIGGKRIVKRHLDQTILVEAKEEQELFDIDKKEDLERLK